MEKKKNSGKPKIQMPTKPKEVKPPPDAEEPLNISDDNPDIIPEEDPYENAPTYESPAPGEGP